jgi:hypothetical protein
MFVSPIEILIAFNTKITSFLSIQKVVFVNFMIMIYDTERRYDKIKERNNGLIHFLDKYMERYKQFIR